MSVAILDFPAGRCPYDDCAYDSIQHLHAFLDAEVVAPLAVKVLFEAAYFEPRLRSLVDAARAALRSTPAEEQPEIGYEDERTEGTGS